MINKLLIIMITIIMANIGFFISSKLYNYSNNQKYFIFFIVNLILFITVALNLIDSLTA